VTLFAKLFMAQKADGSLLYLNEQPVGSSLLAQKFTNPSYFWPRPSAVDYNPLPSGGSNLGPTSEKLKNQVLERMKNFPQGSEIPPDLVYASGSGLDPHISLEAAFFQVDRILKNRKSGKLDRNKLIHLITASIESSFFFGREYVNVLRLNLALDELAHE